MESCSNSTDDVFAGGDSCLSTSEKNCAHPNVCNKSVIEEAHRSAASAVVAVVAELMVAEIELGSLCARNGSHSTSLEMRLLKEQNDRIETEEKARSL